MYLYTRNTVACRSPLGCKEREWCDKIILITFQNFTHSSYVVDLKANKLGLLLSPEILSHYVNSMYKWDSCCRAEGRECEPFNPKYRVAITNNALVAHPHIYQLIITNYQLIFNHSWLLNSLSVIIIEGNNQFLLIHLAHFSICIYLNKSTLSLVNYLPSPSADILQKVHSIRLFDNGFAMKLLLLDKCQSFD